MTTGQPSNHKIIFAGLSAVGKTSIYQSVIENVDLFTIENLQPTRGIERKFLSVANQNLVFWDLGGQEIYRARYFQDPRVFADTTLLIYVLDIQDQDRFDESIDYLLQILMIIKNMDIIPRVFVLIHKYDFEKRTDLRNNLLEAANILKIQHKFPSVKITKYTTSIYNTNLDSVVEGIIKEIIPDYSNDLIRHTYLSKLEVDDEEYKQTLITDELISSIEIKVSKGAQKSDFQKESSTYISKTRDLIRDKSEEKSNED